MLRTLLLPLTYPFRLAAFYSQPPTAPRGCSLTVSEARERKGRAA